MMCSYSGNQTPASSCMYSNNVWNENKEDCWIEQEADDFYLSHITAPAILADAPRNNNEIQEMSKPLREMNSKKNCAYKHVPHKDKPPQVVAKRNARERRRVQAVNGAFVKLRKAIPLENTRGKRVSKVKTLQIAIQYIKEMKGLLQQDKEQNGKSFCQFSNTRGNYVEFLEKFYHDDGEP